MQGTLFLVVGPSGVGKDTLLAGARARLGVSRWFAFTRRVITRPADPDGENHEPETEARFATRLAAGAFLHHWRAHGLSYGIPAEVLQQLKAGINVILNTSRQEIAAFQALWPRVVTILITASPDIIEARLRARGREDEADIRRRLARIVETNRAPGAVLRILNDSTPEEGVDQLVRVITGACDLLLEVKRSPIAFQDRATCLIHKDNPVASGLFTSSPRASLTLGEAQTVAEVGVVEGDSFITLDQCALSATAIEALGATPGAIVRLERSPSPQSRAILQKKVQGAALSRDEFDHFLSDLLDRRYSDAEIAGFLVAASTNLTLDEVIDLTRARADYAPRQTWDADVVVDKHSMGGIPGNRITPIVVAIVAAHGLVMPKTSSRAITSAAGTADMMEVLARVDLTREQMQQVVRQTGGCVVWNGRLTHSPVDDVMNAINRPLGLRSSLLDVSSIMSKKLAAGSSHVLIDLPVGPLAKTRTDAEAEALAAMFVAVGEGVGLNVRVNRTDGTRPIGRGIGPALEARDVLAVLDNSADAPADLRAKALRYAADIIEWAGGAAPGDAMAITEALIASGAAASKLRDIIDAQGSKGPVAAPGGFTRDLAAEGPGRVGAFDIRMLSSLARAAGAPLDKVAGLDILAAEGTPVEAGAPVLRIHAATQQGLDQAAQEMKRLGTAPFEIERD